MSKDPEEEEVVSLHGFKSDGPLAKFNDSLAIVVAMTRCIFVFVRTSHSVGWQSCETLEVSHNSITFEVILVSHGVIHV